MIIQHRKYGTNFARMEKPEDDKTAIAIANGFRQGEQLRLFRRKSDAKRTERSIVF